LYNLGFTSIGKGNSFLSWLSMDKDIRLLGDIVKYKLADWNIPVRTYLLLESLLLLILSGEISFLLPFVQSEVTLQPLVVALLGVVYGYQVGVRGVAVYILLFAVGFPLISGAGWADLCHPAKLGYLIGFFPCTLIAASLATFHWDRRLYLSIPMLLVSLVCIPFLQAIFTNIWKSSFDLIGAISWSFIPILLQVFLGASLLSILWKAAEGYLESPKGE